jgi:hypothetical protein
MMRYLVLIAAAAMIFHIANTEGPRFYSYNEMDRATEVCGDNLSPKAMNICMYNSLENWRKANPNALRGSR